MIAGRRRIDRRHLSPVLGDAYRQFSVTLAVSIFFSFVLAITLTPALCATLLKPHTHSGAGGAPEPAPGMRGLPRRLGNGFNERFGRTTEKYTRTVGTMLSAPIRWLAVFAVMVVVTLLLFVRLPGGFLPTEDQGVVLVNYDAAPGATLQRTGKAVEQAEAWLQKQPEVRSVTTVIGFNFFSQGQSSALSFVDLKPWGERAGADRSAEALIGRANAAFSTIPEAVIFGLSPPPIAALGNAVGFTMKIEGRGGHGGDALEQARDRILAEASKNPILAGVRPEGPPPAPQLYVDIDRIQARALGLQIADVNQTLSIAFGSVYANDFVREGSVLRVYLQADADQRMTPEQILALRVRNNQGEMVPFSSFTSVKWRSGPQQLERYNGYPALTISGQAAPGESSGAALEEMERSANTVLTSDQRFEWTGTAYEEKQAGSQIGLLLGLSLVVIFLLLAALYGSWAIPLSVLLIVPFGMLGAVLFSMLRGFPADVYFNVGLITVIGLAAKNAILIVEFAMDEERLGKDARTATLEAVRQRLRPILMTSFAFILGMVPLVIASGAGAASRQAVGTGVAGGMLVATLLGLFFTPVFYIAARKWLSRDNDHEAEDREETARLERDRNDGQAGETTHA